MIWILLLIAWLPFGLASLPYIPTTALSSSADPSVVYIFGPNNDTTSAALLLINGSNTISSSPSTVTISNTLPFLSGGANSAFLPLIDDDGDIFVLAGECGQGANGTSLWTLGAGQDEEKGNWVQAGLTTAGLSSSLDVGGINYLASGSAFSSTRNDTPSLYTFGGMCPNASISSLSASTWQYSANYSNALLEAAPSVALASSSFASVTSSNNAFELAQVQSRGPPVAEAGSSMTALQPSYSGPNDTTVQQNLVLIGGHTAQAFINMSQVALLSLPEQAWSFLPVSGPGEASGELVKRDTTAIEPRSGHTAVLTEDGSKIIVYGGWVGDVYTPALPQLAVLQLGSGYGGSGDWQWSIPDTQGNGAGGSGIYGHGAVMLPGNVMMVVGGTTLTEQGSRKVKRALSQAYFFNVTSSSWTTDYTNPNARTSVPGNQAGGTTGPSTGKRTGLGVGLGVGLALLLLVLLLSCFCWRRRQRRHRQKQDMLDRASMNRDMNQQMISHEGAYDPGQRMVEVHQNHSLYQWPASQNGIPGPNAQEVGWRDMRTAEAERTGLLVDIPSPTRGLRRSLHSRGSSYHDEGRRSRASGHIHVIDERDEYESGWSDPRTARPDEAHLGPSSPPASRPASSRVPNIVTEAPTLNPFVDPLGSHPVTFGTSRTPSPTAPTPEADQERDEAGWIEDWEAIHARMREHGTSNPEIARQRAEGTMQNDRVSPLASENNESRKGSPNHSDRTGSTLSEVSMRSAVSFLSKGSSGKSSGSLRRNPSQRSSHIFSVRNRGNAGTTRRSMPATGTVATAVAAIEGTPLVQASRSRQARHSPGTLGDLTRAPPAATIRHPSFGTLQAESQALLSGRSAATPATHLGHSTNIEPESAEWVDPDEDDEFPQRPAQRRSLMGSVRSVLNRGARRGSSPTNPATAATSPTAATFSSGSPTRATTGTPFSMFPGSTTNESGPSPTAPPTMPIFQPSGPRRTVSAGSEPWQRRQSGARDWDWQQGRVAAVRDRHAHVHHGGDDAQRSSLAVPGHLHPQGSSSGDTSSTSPGKVTITDSLRDDISGEWDVEGAVETRQVQVMFTVPRERLRVVNAADGDAESVITGREADSGRWKGTTSQETEGKGNAEEEAQGQAECRAEARNVETEDEEDTGLIRQDSRYKPGRGSPSLW